MKGQGDKEQKEERELKRAREVKRGSEIETYRDYEKRDEEGGRVSLIVIKDERERVTKY